MRGPQTITEQRMAKDIQDIEIKVNNIIENSKKTSKAINAMGTIALVGTVFLYVLMGILFL